jgi:hypothetical protein
LPLRDAAPVAFAMVGLPARGKSYIARKLFRYLSWLGHKTKVFNVGSYRRESLGAYQNAAFFDPDNPEGQRLLNDLAMRALDDMIEWFDSGGQVGIYDATNTTRARRKLFVERCRSKGVPVVFIESICDDPRVIDANVRETKLSSPDYLGADPDDAVQDFRERIANYGRVYEPVGDDEGSYIKIIDVGRQVVLNRISGYIPDRILPLLIRMHVTPRPILFTRHGESEFNARGLLGGDPELSPRGVEYSRSLAKFIDERFGDTPITVWTSTLRRTIQTAAALGRKSVAWRTLDEIDGGICDGMTYAEIKEKMPDVHAARSLDKFGYRYPARRVVRRRHPARRTRDHRDGAAADAGAGDRPPGRAARGVRVLHGSAGPGLPLPLGAAAHRRGADADGLRRGREAPSARAADRGLSRWWRSPSRRSRRTCSTSAVASARRANARGWWAAAYATTCSAAP